MLASIDPPSVWNVYSSLEAAASAREEANAYSARLDAQRGHTRAYEPMTREEYLRQERAYYLRDPEREIGEEEFTRMLEVLPPEHWEHQGDWERFILSEHKRGPYADQFIRRGDGDAARFFTKIVDAEDRDTWMRGR